MRADITIFKFLSNSHVSLYNKDSVTLNMLDIGIPTSPVTALRFVKLRVERGETRSISYLVRATSAVFSLHAGNTNFGTRNEGVK